jgi:hypothetical protein
MCYERRRAEACVDESAQILFFSFIFFVVAKLLPPGASFCTRISQFSFLNLTYIDSS